MSFNSPANPCLNMGLSARTLMLQKNLVFLSGIVALLFGIATFSVTAFSTSGFLVWSDGLAYFLYARSAVLDLDTDLTNEYEELDALLPADSRLMEPLRAWSQRDPRTGQISTIWPAGAGLVMAPFYALGYSAERLAAKLYGRSPDSYGLIPQFFFGFGSIFFGLLGFWSIVLCCKEIVSDKVAYLSSLGVVFAGPIVFYVFFHPSMAHASSVGIIALLLLLWLRQWNEHTSPRGMAALGLLLGLAVTVRYQNAIFGILLAALVLRQLRYSSLLRVVRIALTGIIACLLPLSLLLASFLLQMQPADGANGQQGSVLVGRYPIDIASPYFFDVLFSCRHGAFFWAPVLAISLLGLAWAALRSGWAGVLVLTFLAQVYLIGGLGLADSVQPSTALNDGWQDRWPGGTSFGMRYLTECGPLLALGLAALIHSTVRFIQPLWWSAVLLALSAWNGLLILGYGLNTISRTDCVPYSAMWTGVMQALSKVLTRLF
jgi:hypothetical protein